MSRAGRKRKHLERREASGQIQRAPAPERAAAIKSIGHHAPHRQIRLPNGKPVDPDSALLESELGRLFLRGAIDASQHAAGRRWSAVVARMRQAIDAPSDRVRGVLGALAGHSGPSREMTPEAAAEARAAYADADHALGYALGPHFAEQVRKVLRLVIIADHPCPNPRALRLGLNILARHFEANRNIVAKRLDISVPTVSEIDHGDLRRAEPEPQAPPHPIIRRVLESRLGVDSLWEYVAAADCETP